VGQMPVILPLVCSDCRLCG